MSEHVDDPPKCGHRKKRWKVFVWLVIELLVSRAVVITLARRNDLEDYSYVLPVVCAIAAVAAFAMVLCRRSVFLLGAIGAIVGGYVYNPRFEVLWNPDSDPGDRAVSCCWMVAENRFVGALVGTFVGIALAVALEWGLAVVSRGDR